MIPGSQVIYMHFYLIFTKIQKVDSFIIPLIHLSKLRSRVLINLPSVRDGLDFSLFYAATATLLTSLLDLNKKLAMCIISLFYSALYRLLQNVDFGLANYFPYRSFQLKLLRITKRSFQILCGFYHIKKKKTTRLLKVAKRLILKVLITHEKSCNYVRSLMLAKLTVVTILHYINI